MFRLVLLGAVFLLLVGCVQPTKIQSVMAAGYAGEPKRIFVVTDVGNEYGAEFSGAFEERLIAIARQCGAQLQVSRMSNLELDTSVHKARMKEFGPDVLLSMRRNGGTRMGAGGPVVHAIYDARLFDANTQKPLWRANLNFYRGGTLIAIKERGEALAIELTNQMKSDGILKSCALIDPPQRPSL